MSENCVLQAATSLTDAKACDYKQHISDTRDVVKRARDNIINRSLKMTPKEETEKLSYSSSKEIVAI